MSQISKSEWEVIRVLWQESPLTASEVRSQLSGHSWSPSTVRTFLSRLENKGLIRAQAKGKIRAYVPVLPREESIRIEAVAFLDRTFDGDVAKLIAHFLTHEKLKKSVLNDLQDLIKQKKKDR